MRLIKTIALAAVLAGCAQGVPVPPPTMPPPTMPPPVPCPVQASADWSWSTSEELEGHSLLVVTGVVTLPSPGWTLQLEELQSSSADAGSLVIELRTTFDEHGATASVQRVHGTWRTPSALRAVTIRCRGKDLIVLHSSQAQ